jgi:hypothetical protein
MVLGIAALFSLNAGDLTAQQASTSSTPINVLPGTRVRVTATNLVAPLVATFLQQRGDTAVFIEDGAGRGIWTISVSQIIRLERSNGEQRSNKPKVIRGAIIGGVVGLGGGLLFASTAKPGNSSKTYDRGLTGGLGMLAGGAIGAFIGTRFAQERWTNIPLPSRASFAPQSTRGGLRLAFGYSF